MLLAKVSGIEILRLKQADLHIPGKKKEKKRKEL